MVLSRVNVMFSAFSFFNIISPIIIIIINIINIIIIIIIITKAYFERKSSININFHI